MPATTSNAIEIIIVQLEQQNFKILLIVFHERLLRFRVIADYSTSIELN